MSQHREFFTTQREHSRLKSEIVAAYLPAWATVIWKSVQSHGGAELTYLDVFSGPGEFDDGGRSTPLLILDEVAKIPWLADVLRMRFFEGDAQYYASLIRSVSNHPITPKLKIEPEFNPGMLTREDVLAIGKSAGDGTYTFIDPFGFKELSLDLLLSVSQQWGCDTLFYLNVSGIERNIGDPSQKEQMVKLFGENGYVELSSYVGSDAESSLPVLAVEKLKASLRKNQFYYFLSYCVEFDERRYPSHYLVFLSKHQKGFEIMRDILIKRSMKDVHGFPLYLHSPLRERDNAQAMLPLVLQDSRMHTFSTELLKRFAGKNIAVKSLLDKCLKLGCQYRNPHIKQTLWHMHENGMAKIQREGIQSAEEIKGSDCLVFGAES